MFDATTYRPYQGTSFAWASQNVLHAACPWLAMDVDVEPDKTAAVASVLARLSKQPESVADADIQEFLAFFSDYPLLHVQPRRINGAVAPYASAAPELMGASGPLQFLKSINPFPEIDLDAAFAYFPQEWEWDLEQIAAASAIPATDLYDPMSAYTAIRARRLQFQIENAHHAQNLLSSLEQLRLNDEARFFDVMSVILSQQYYVTRECPNCLLPAIANHLVIADQIRAYMGEEQNHDRLILRSIRAISDTDSEAFYFSPEVKLEIEVIKYAARTCALGFSALVSIMEGTVYPESDPVGDILLKSSRPESHQGVEAHFQINRGSNHTAIPETFVARIPPVPLETLRIMSRLAEVTIRLDSGLARTMSTYLERLGRVDA